MPPVWTDLGHAAALVQDGDLVALGGHTRDAPMALIRELIRQGRRDLGLVTVPTGGLNVDLAIGAGLVSRLHFAQVGLGEFGLAPHFRRAHGLPGVLRDGRGPYQPISEKLQRPRGL